MKKFLAILTLAAQAALGQIHQGVPAVVPGANVTTTTNLDGSVVVSSSGGGGGSAVAGTNVVITTTNIGTNTIQVISTSSAVVTNTQTNIVYGFFTNSTENIINIQSCGAIPSGQIANYCAIATGGTALVREDGLAFTYGDVGKIIKITQAGSGGINDFTTGIAAWVTNNQVTLSNAVPFGISNTFAIYGYDSTAGITNALAVASNSLVNGRNVTLLVPDGIYMVNGPLLDTGGFSNHHNAQLVLPVMPDTLAGNTSPTLTITGCSPPQASYYAVSNYSTAFGAVFWSTLVSVPNGRFIAAMGGEGSTGSLSGGPSTGSYTVLANPLRVNIQRMTFLVPVNSNLRILDCEGALGAQFGELNLGTGQGQFVCAQPTNYWSAALVTPGSGSIGDVNIKDIWINGMFNGMIPSEHVCQNGELNINCCVNAIEVTNGFGHPAVFQNCAITSCKNGIVLGANSGARIYGVFAIEDTATNYWSYPMNVFANGGVNGQGLIGEEWISYSMSAPPANIGTVPALCHYNQPAGLDSYSPSLGAANYTVGAPYVQTNLGMLFESYPDANNNPGFFINQTNPGQRSIMRFSTADNVEWDLQKTDTSDQLWFRVVGAGINAFVLDAVNQSISFYPSWPISGLGSGLTGTATALSIGGNAATATVASNATTSTSSNSSVTISVSVNPKGQTNYDLAVSVGGSTNAVTTNVSGAYSSLMPATNLSGTIPAANLPQATVGTNGVMRVDNVTLTMNAMGIIGLQAISSNFFNGNGGGYTITNIGSLGVSNGVYNTIVTNWGVIISSNGVTVGYLSNNNFYCSGTNTAGYFSGSASNLTSLPANQLTSIGNGAGGAGNFFTGNAGNATTTGSYNTAFGYVSLSGNTTGAHNTAIGGWALVNNVAGGGNTAIGYEALYNTKGNNNTANGYAALQYNVVGYNNTANGYAALYNSTNSYNIGIGYLAGSNILGPSNCIYIGNTGLVTDTNNIIRIGQGQSNCYVAGTVTSTGGYASTANGTYSVGATGITNIWTNTIKIPNFAGVSVVYSNANSATTATLGTVTSQLQILGIGDSLSGTGCSGDGFAF